MTNQDKKIEQARAKVVRALVRAVFKNVNYMELDVIEIEDEGTLITILVKAL